MRNKKTMKFHPRPELYQDVRISRKAKTRLQTHSRRLRISQPYLIEILILNNLKNLTRTELKKKGYL